jgi:hypothetical protein
LLINFFTLGLTRVKKTKANLQTKSDKLDSVEKFAHITVCFGFLLILWSILNTVIHRCKQSMFIDYIFHMFYNFISEIFSDLVFQCNEMEYIFPSFETV